MTFYWYSEKKSRVNDSLGGGGAGWAKRPTLIHTQNQDFFLYKNEIKNLENNYIV